MTIRPGSPAEMRHPHSGGRSRRRGDLLEAALLDAAWQELQAVGYAAMTMEAVADRAGTSRAVFYRRWPKRADLVIATLRRHAPPLSSDAPDTGSLRGDVVALLERESRQLAKAGIETIYGLLGDYLADADLFSRIHDQLVDSGLKLTTIILKRAVERGEARDDWSSAVASLPTNLFRNQLFLHRTPPPRSVIVEIVDELFLPLVRL
jgi:AcrR family transcriptional regulator